MRQGNGISTNREGRALTMHSASALPPTLEEEELRQIVIAVFQKEKEFNLKYVTCGGEWGQFSKRKEFFVERYGDVAYGLVKKIKAAFDPNNILNPGMSGVIGDAFPSIHFEGR